MKYAIMVNNKVNRIVISAEEAAKRDDIFEVEDNIQTGFIRGEVPGQFIKQPDKFDIKIVIPNSFILGQLTVDELELMYASTNHRVQVIKDLILNTEESKYLILRDNLIFLVAQNILESERIDEIFSDKNMKEYRKIY